jgi:hypothetical protein
VNQIPVVSDQVGDGFYDTSSSQDIGTESARKKSRCEWAGLSLLVEGENQQSSRKYRLIESGGEDGEDAGKEATKEGSRGF